MPDATISGEVLEEMKAAHALSGNGGLIVTFLLDEPALLPLVDHPPTAAAADDDAGSRQQRCKLAAVVTWDDGRDYGAGVPVPAELVDEQCPAEVFASWQQTSSGRGRARNCCCCCCQMKE